MVLVAWPFLSSRWVPGLFWVCGKILILVQMLYKQIFSQIKCIASLNLANPSMCIFLPCHALLDNPMWPICLWNKEKQGNISGCWNKIKKMKILMVKVITYIMKVLPANQWLLISLDFWPLGYCQKIIWPKKNPNHSQCKSERGKINK